MPRPNPCRRDRAVPRCARGRSSHPLAPPRHGTAIAVSCIDKRSRARRLVPVTEWLMPSGAATPRGPNFESREDRGGTMASLTSRFVEPLYRWVYGRLSDRPGTGDTEDARGKADRARGLVLVADGVGGLDLCGTGLRYVIGADRLPYAVEVFPWGHGLGRWYADLTDVANRDQQARLVAEAVRRYRADQPGDPVFLVAKSGGAGVVVKAVELLEDDSVECAVLLAPALSPGYDLTRALRAVRRELVVFWSPLDMVVLGAGTRLFGTIDRVRTVGAGMVSFVVPGADDPDEGRSLQYAKLRQVRWRPEMAATFYFGGHVGPDCPLFLRKYIVPLLRAGESVRG